MKLASLRGGRDGALVVVRRDGQVYEPADAVAATLQQALDAWERVEPGLRRIARELDDGTRPGWPVPAAIFDSPLPRAFEWLDGSAFLAHVARARKARGVALPDDLTTTPLVYQGGAGASLGPRDDVPFGDPRYGLDCEGELVIFVSDVPMGIGAREAERCIRLIGLANDWTLRHLVPGELARGFGFVQSKPATAFAPFAITPDELGPAWRDGRVSATVEVYRGDVLLGRCDAGEMHFGFGELISHVARTRRLSAGTIMGSGTVSNDDERNGVACIVERRALEIIANGRAETHYLTDGERIRMRLVNERGDDLCGAIDQRITSSHPFERPSP